MPFAGRVYTVSLGATAQAGAIDFLELVPASNHPCLLLALMIGQTTELGDAQEEQIEFTIQRGGTLTSGSGGSTPTPRPVDFGDAAAGFTVEMGNTTQGSFTSGVTLHDGTFNVRAGMEMFWTPETCFKFGASNAGLVRMQAAPVDSITWTCVAYIEEL